MGETTSGNGETVAHGLSSIAREQESYAPAGYAWYVVGVLTLAYIFSFIDRQILSLMVGPIQQDLRISDTQMSLLMGLTFAVFYTFFGIPLGRLADTSSRRLLIAVGVAAWSVMTAGCGLAGTFWQLAVFRMGVGVGEATLSPSAYSLISDYFRPEERSTAISVYSMAIYIGAGLAFILGGSVTQLAAGQQSPVLPLVGAVHSWQLVFFIVGLPGLLVALLLLTIREPDRKGATKNASSIVPPVPLRAVWAYMRDNRATFLCLNLGIGMVALYGYGATSWVPSLFIRRYGWTPRQTGLVFGLIVAVGGTLGIVTGGKMADWLRRRGHPDGNVRVALLAAAAGLPFVVLFPLAPTGHWAATLLAPVVFFMSAPFGVAPAAIQQMMPNTMRASATALYLFVINLVGMGLGPTVVAILTDDVFRDKKAVHLSLLVVGAFAFASASVLLWFGVKSYRASLDYMKRWRETDRIDRSTPLG
ncbi:MAG: spinster family MFS transporter [Isosphaerales bacterium]